MAIALVNETYAATPGLSGAATTITLSSTATTGNLLVIVIRYQHTSRTVSAVVDDQASVTYVEDSGLGDGNENCSIWYGVAGATVTSIDVTLSGGIFGDDSVTVLEFSGCTGAVTGTSVITTTSGAVTAASGTVTPATANNVMVAYNKSGSETYVDRDAAFTTVTGADTATGNVKYLIQSATTAQEFNVESSNNIGGVIGMSAFAGTAGGEFSLAADSGSFTLTGTAAALEANREVAGESGSFALTGTDSTLLYNQRPSASSSSIASNGLTVTVVWTEAVDIGAGGNGGLSLVMSGGTADATYVSGDGADTYVFTSDRVIKVGETGTLLYSQPGDGFEDSTGLDVTSFFGFPLTNGSTVNAYTMAADTDSYLLGGTDVSLVLTGGLTAESGTFTLTGTDVSIPHSAYMLAEMGVIQMDADDVNFDTGIRLDAESGSFALTGTDVAFSRSYVALTAESGTFSLSGTAASLFRNALLSGDSGTYTLTGSDVTFSYTGGQFAISAESGAFVLTGTAVDLRFGPRLAAESGSFTLTGADITLRYSEEGIFVISVRGDVGKRLSRVGGKKVGIRAH